MADYIDRQAAIDAILAINDYGNSDRANALGLAEFAITTLPSADAVEVVRCRDCKWCEAHYDTDGNAPYWICGNWDGGTDADGFCHEAERKIDG